MNTRTEIQNTVAALRFAALALRTGVHDEPTDADDQNDAAAEALENIARDAELYARDRAELEAQIDRQAEIIAELQRNEERESELVTSRDAWQSRALNAEERARFAEADARQQRDRALTLAQDLTRNARYIEQIEAELATTRTHLQAALRARDAARDARATDAQIRKASR